MRIVMAASEALPFAKTGGLGDVLGALPAALAGIGLDVSVILPNYGFIEHLAFGIEPTGIVLEVPVSSLRVPATVFRTTLTSGVTVYFIGADRYFARPGIYGEGGGDYSDNAERFAFFSRAVLALVQNLGGCDILHCHDWQTGLAPAFLRYDTGGYPDLAPVRTLMTIHNLGYQGRFWSQDWHLLNLDRKYFTPEFLEFYGDINYLKAGLVSADTLTTVSPTYAREIQTPALGHGLDGVLRARRSQLHGILNGVDYEEWDPEHDRLIAATFSRRRRRGKQRCKDDLQATMGLERNPDVAVIGMVSRLVDQKGFDLVAEVFPLLLQRPVQFVLVGSGDPRHQEFFRHQAAVHPGRVAAQIGFDNTLAHKIEAGSDLFLMPSLYEPCGLNQMYSQRYGTIPIVRATGGLEDSVVDPESGASAATGFKFVEYSASALLACIDRALHAYGDAKTWGSLINQAMRADYSWKRSAHEYLQLYDRLRPASFKG